jgi:hypothetical protein
MIFSHAHADHERQEQVHGGTPALATSLVSVMIAFLIGVFLLFLVLAWSPWSNGGSAGNNPGQGGSNNQPQQEEQLPQQRIPR